MLFRKLHAHVMQSILLSWFGMSSEIPKELAVDLSKIDSFSFALPHLEARDSPTRRLSILEDL